MNARPRSGYPVLALLALVILMPVLGLLSLGSMPGYESTQLRFWESLYLRRALNFSLWQAMLSALCSVAPAILVARALTQTGHFPLRGLLLRLFGVPLVVPSVVAVMAIVSVYGSDGWIPLGRSLYGLNGILLAHVFFNLPLAVRLLLPLLETIPRHHRQLGEQLGFNAWQRWKYIEWPALREGLPGVVLLVFMLCLTSFAVVLTLGGGPRSTTLELAIYQSLRLDFDPQRAVLLAFLQLFLCAMVAFAALRLQKLPEVEITISDAAGSIPGSGRMLALPIIFAAAVYVGMPLLSLVIDAVFGPLAKVLTNPALWRAAVFSLCIGLVAAVLSSVCGWLLLRTSSDLAWRGRSLAARWIENGASIVYVVPPLVIGTGYFVLISPHADVFAWALPIVILVNTLMGLPFVLRTLGPAMRQNQMQHGLLCLSLGLEGWQRWRLVDWPRLRQSFGLSAALVAALAMGDLGVIALFGSPDTATLPLLLYQQLGAYRIDEAAVTALFLLLLCLAVFWVFERALGGRSHA